MDSRRRMNLWMMTVFALFAVASVIQNGHTAPVKNKGSNSEESSREEGRRHFVPKYMMDLYNIIVDKHGNRRKGISTTANNIKCFLSGKHFTISIRP